MERPNNRNNHIKYISVAIIIVLLVISAFIFLKIWEERQDSFPENDFDENIVEYNGISYSLKENIETFLVLGLDKYEGTKTVDSYNNDKQSDFLMLFVLDKSVQKCYAIHINRDTMVDVNVLGVAGNKIDVLNQQIALAHTYGNGRDISCRNVAESVTKLLYGIKVDHYMSLTMDSVAVLNDLVGGVTVTVLDDFSGIDDTLIKGQSVNLQGDQALRYVRTRYGLEDSTNSTRMERQQQYINALSEEFKKKATADENFIVEATIKMSDYIVSDRSITQLQELLRKFNTYEFCGIYDIEGESQQGEKFIEFYADRKTLEKTVIELFYKEAE